MLSWILLIHPSEVGKLSPRINFVPHITRIKVSVSYPRHITGAFSVCKQNEHFAESAGFLCNSRLHTMDTSILYFFAHFSRLNLAENLSEPARLLCNPKFWTVDTSTLYCFNNFSLLNLPETIAGTSEFYFGSHTLNIREKTITKTYNKFWGFNKDCSRGQSNSVYIRIIHMPTVVYFRDIC